MPELMNGRALVRGVFERVGLPRLAFLPWVFTHAARLEQLSLRRLYGDATQYVKCVQNARKLYGYDAIATGLDGSVAAEVAGGPVVWSGGDALPEAKPLPGFDPGRLPGIDMAQAGKLGRFAVVLESLRRIKMVHGPSVALAATLPGPLTLAAQLTGSDIEAGLGMADMTAAFLLGMAQELCREEPDLVVVADPLIGGLTADQMDRLEAALAPLVNTVRFYNAATILIPGEVAPGKLGGLIGLGFDGIAAANIDFETWEAARADRLCALGVAIPSTTLTEGASAVKDYLEKYLPKGREAGVFVTTEGDVPAATPPESLRAVMDTLKGNP
jgi:uroporphyrinogen-III decarboxylase